VVTELGVILKRFELPDEIRTFSMGRFEIARLGGVAIGRAIYEPGWRWSIHIGIPTGQKTCQIEHVGLVISGTATAAMNNGQLVHMHAGDLFFVPPGHDSWVVGDEPYVSLHFLGTEEYAGHVYGQPLPSG
jgi:hypothetical protein